MLRIGCHLSVSGGFLAMGKTAYEIGANTFQYFTRNPRGGAAKAISEADVIAFTDFSREHGLGEFLAHAPYTLNLCSDKKSVAEFARNTLSDDLLRVAGASVGMYNIHPGSHVGQGMETGITMISDALNSAIDAELSVTVLLETMSGKGSEVGGRFEELREIIGRAEHPEKLGVCLDTCHVYDAGYDIVGSLDEVLTEFDRVIGLPRLKAVHLNDSKNPIASHKDRHETIGSGSIGIECFRRIINHPALRNLPFFLETPNELPGYAEEIKLLSGIYDTNTK